LFSKQRCGGDLGGGVSASGFEREEHNAVGILEGIKPNEFCGIRFGARG
jgi:hypothetical protein